MQAIKGSILKIAITLPITIAISLFLVYATAKMQPENRQQLSGFVHRAESISNVNDRLKYWEPAFLMVRLHPFFGPGLESFSSQYEKLYVAPGHQYTQTPKYDVAPFYGSAHNLYFQTLAGKGYLGLLSLFGVFFTVFSLVWRGILSPTSSGVILTQPQRLILMMTLAYTCALAIYGNVGEIFYSPIGYILFILFYAGSIACVPPAYRLSLRFRAWVLGLLALAFIAHLYLEFRI
jgi:O-antigen ligase